MWAVQLSLRKAVSLVETGKAASWSRPKGTQEWKLKYGPVEATRDFNPSRVKWAKQTPQSEMVEILQAQSFPSPTH